MLCVSLMWGHAASYAAQSHSSLAQSQPPSGWPTRPLTSFYTKFNVAACNDKPGGAMWFIKLNGPGSARVTYGVRVDGQKTDKSGTVRLVDMPGLNEKQLFCSKSGKSTFEPFLISQAMH